ncbi:MAG: hypothetical protein KC501_05395 [Myxococcales bacterium]|nr:hypothetical protein [Myxococcales bacterium]
MLRPLAISAAALGLVSACGSTPAPASTEPATPAPAATPDGPAPPMYKPSSRSPAPMSIADPAYGAYSAAPGAPTLGDTLPDFEVALADGGTFSLADARRAGPVLIMFYRGFW